MATMKLRIRSLESKQTLKIEIPTPSTLQQLKQTLSQSLSSSASSSSPSIHLSLNRKDELHASSPEASLQSLGITSGDLIFFTLNPTGFSSSSQILAPNSDSSSNSVQRPLQTLAPNFPNLENPSEIPPEFQTIEQIPSNQDTPVRDLSVQGPEIADSDMSDSKSFQEHDGSVVLNSENEGTLEFSCAETMGVDDVSVSTGKKFSERCFLRRVLSKELGDYGGDHALFVIAVHAVFLESGFVGFDSVSGMRVDRFHLADEWPSNVLSVSLWYTLPELLGHGYCNFGNVVESVCLKFQSLGHLVTIYGSLAKGGSGLHRVCLNENRFVPAISLANSDSVDSINEENGYPESEIFEFWKMVKDGLVLPLLIDLCEKTGLGLPPCFMRLPAELKLKILESLHGVDLAKVGCVCSEFRYLSSRDELWKQKFDEEFGRAAGAQGIGQWKAKFASFWESSKKRKTEAGRYRGFLQRHFLIQENPFGAPMVVGDHDRMPGLAVASPFGRSRGIQWLRLGGSNV